MFDFGKHFRITLAVAKKVSDHKPVHINLRVSAAPPPSSPASPPSPRRRPEATAAESEEDAMDVVLGAPQNDEITAANQGLSVAALTMIVCGVGAVIGAAALYIHRKRSSYEPIRGAASGTGPVYGTTTQSV